MTVYSYRTMPTRKPVIEVLDDDMAQILRGMTGAERLRIANGMFESARKMLTSHLTHEHPDWDPERVREEVARRLAHGAV